MSALEQWRAEIASGERTMYAPMDALWSAACREIADEEFERDVAAPQRAYLEQLTAPREIPEKESRAKWAVVMAWGDDDESDDVS